MLTRRSFLRASGALGSSALVAGRTSMADVFGATARIAGRSPEVAASDEAYWQTIRAAYSPDLTLINLNNGDHSPAPRVVQESLKRYLDAENQLPAYYAGVIARTAEGVRRGLAAEFGCDGEELAITRNTTEALHIVQAGIDLRPGDEVITTEQDYPRMLAMWDQRARRDGIVVRRLQFHPPATQDDLVRVFEGAVTPRTKILHFCHITNLTGQLFPVQRLCALARERGILTIVDGAHAVAHVPVNLHALGCDYYGTSLHKWLCAPVGNGFLYVRRDRIAATWPLHGSPASQAGDIRKFEQVGTMPAGTHAAIAEALAFHQSIGTARKAARLRYLTLRWAHALRAEPRVRIHSSLEPGEACGIGCVGVEGLDTRALNRFLLDRHHIVSIGLVGEKPPAQVFDYEGLRVTPNVYTTLDEIDRFVAAMQEAIRNGLPKANSA